MASRPSPSRQGAPRAWQRMLSGRRLDLLDRLCDEHGRAERPTICFTPISTWADPERLLDEIGRLTELFARALQVARVGEGAGADRTRPGLRSRIE